MNGTPEPSFRDLMAILRRGIGFAIVLALVGAAITYVVTTRMTPSYRGTATLHVAATDPVADVVGTPVVSAPEMEPSAYAAAVTIRPVLEAALGRLGQPAPGTHQLEEFRERIDVRVGPEAEARLLHIRVHGEDPVIVAQEANALAESVLSWDQERSEQAIERIVSTLEMHVQTLDEQIDEAQQLDDDVDELDPQELLELRAEQQQQLLLARTLLASAWPRVEIFEPAAPPLQPITPRPVRDTILTGVLALILGLALVLARHALRSGVRDTDELARVARQPILAEFPPRGRRDRDAQAGAADLLRAGVAYGLQDRKPWVVMITSAVRGQGVSSIAIRLAESFARSGESTLLIDADLREPDLHTMLSVDKRNARTGGDYEATVDDPLGTSVIDLGSGYAFDLLPAPNSIEAPVQFLSAHADSLLSRAKARYSVIVVKAAPIFPHADTLSIAPRSDGAVVVASMVQAQQRDIRAAIGLLERTGTRVLGVVANDVDQNRGHVGTSGAGYEGTRTAT